MPRCPELNSLRLLLGVATTGSITEAARLEGVSQPAASKRLHALERTMAVPLIERMPTGSRLTPEGKLVAAWATRVFEDIEQMFDSLAAMRLHPDAGLNLASSVTVAEHLFPVWLTTLRTESKDAHVALRVTNSKDVQQLVIDGEADLGLVETRVLDRRLMSAVIAHDRLTVVVSPAHPWASRTDPLGAEDLAATQLIVREEGSGTRETLARLVNSHSSAAPVLELGSNAAVKGAVKAGAGPAVLSILAVREELRSGSLVEVPVEGLDLRRPLSAVWLKGKTLTPASKALLEAAHSATVRQHSRRFGGPSKASRETFPRGTRGRHWFDIWPHR